MIAAAAVNFKSTLRKLGDKNSPKSPPATSPPLSPTPQRHNPTQEKPRGDSEDNWKDTSESNFVPFREAETEEEVRRKITVRDHHHTRRRSTRRSRGNSVREEWKTRLLSRRRRELGDSKEEPQIEWYTDLQGRLVHIDGWLVLDSRGKPLQRWFRLVRDLLVYYDERQPKDTARKGKVPEGVISMRKIKAIYQNQSQKSQFRIIIQDVSITLGAKDEDDALDWMCALRQAKLQAEQGSQLLGNVDQRTWEEVAKSYDERRECSITVKGRLLFWSKRSLFLQGGILLIKKTKGDSYAEREMSLYGAFIEPGKPDCTIQFVIPQEGNKKPKSYLFRFDSPDLAREWHRCFEIQRNILQQIVDVVLYLYWQRSSHDGPVLYLISLKMAHLLLLACVHFLKKDLNSVKKSISSFASGFSCGTKQKERFSMRDRTYEFLQLTNKISNAKHQGEGTVAVPLLVNDRQIQPSRGRKTQFSASAAQIGRDIASTYEKLENLTKLAKKRSLYDDPTEQIQSLTAVINQDIKNLNSQISYLQQEREILRKNKQTDQHSDSIVNSLKYKLKGATKGFTQVLELRTENLKNQQKEKETFTGASIGRNRSEKVSSLYRNHDPQQEPGDEVAIPMPQQSMAVYQDRYLEDRAEVVANITRTIGELQGIFGQLATLVAEQHESIQRIDENVEATSSRVAEAQNELLKYLNSISNNRTLVLKPDGIPREISLKTGRTNVLYLNNIMQFNPPNTNPPRDDTQPNITGGRPEMGGQGERPHNDLNSDVRPPHGDDITPPGLDFNRGPTGPSFGGPPGGGGSNLPFHQG
ncbi:Stx5a protein [Planoprotostelium fungivorum]|uniref:Stx5a protein n=1 Tax=Planoprotostelium fungivorum TaxID=1890364 RepID=A0A2P6NIS7_9EUKA|nr:Stx5a protein [Planoprotostelium fungivorum]